MLGFSNEIRRVASHVAAVEDVDHAKLLDFLVAERGQRDVDELFFESTGEPAPSMPGWQRTHQRDLATA